MYGTLGAASLYSYSSSIYPVVEAILCGFVENKIDTEPKKAPTLRGFVVVNTRRIQTRTCRAAAYMAKATVTARSS